MTTGRTDYRSLTQLEAEKIDPLEPVFVIRAKDQIGADAVRAYADLARAAGASEQLIRSALAQAEAMDAWPVKQLPDLVLSEGQSRQADYAAQRRAHREMIEREYDFTSRGPVGARREWRKGHE